MLVQIADRPRDQRLGLLGVPAATHHEDWRVHAKVADAPGFTDGEVERRNPEGGEKLFHRILGGDDGDDRSGCFRCTPVAVENVHVSVSPSPAARAADGGDRDYFSSHFLEDGWRESSRTPGRAPNSLTDHADGG